MTRSTNESAYNKLPGVCAMGVTKDASSINAAKYLSRTYKSKSDHGLATEIVRRSLRGFQQSTQSKVEVKQCKVPYTRRRTPRHVLLSNTYKRYIAQDIQKLVFQAQTDID